MIKVTRLECPDILKPNQDPVSDGEFETKDSIVFFTDVLNVKEKYKRIAKNGASRTQDSFQTYRDSTIRKQLVKMFHGKCAYCETKFNSAYSGDIEHFRPKGGYGDPLVKPGYYWLASDWDNLLFSCALCNQTHTLEVLENEEIIEIVAGKLNEFPLEKEDNRLAVAHGRLFFTNSNEYKRLYALEEGDRLLLKPCTDEIEKHFKYLDEGVILPNDNLTNLELKRAKTSISTFVLKRVVLNQEREEKVILIKEQIQRVKEAIFNLNLNSGDIVLKDHYDAILQGEITKLKRFKNDDQPFAGLARYIITKHFPELDTI